MQPIKDFIFRLIHLFPGGRLLTQKYLLSKNFLSRSGWKRSVRLGLPVDNSGKPTPWFTFGAIYFLQGRIRPDMEVFEFGSGNSTLWFAARTARVVSVEHHAAWFTRMKSQFLHNPSITYTHCSLEDGAYATEIRHYQNAFDIVVIDGRDRVQCARNSLKALKEGGVIVWDNSDRETYAEGYAFLLENGFKRLDFFGAGPLSAHAWCTSIFYREYNCLGI